MTKLLDEQITYKSYIAKPPEVVFETLTTARGWDSWFTQGTTIDPKVGGILKLCWVNFGAEQITAEAECPIVKIEAPNCFAFEWESFSAERLTTVTFNLTAEHGGTMINLTETGYIDTPESRRMQLVCASGWGEALCLLKFWLEYGVVYEELGE